MKVRIGHYDVEISATNEYLKDSDTDPTLSFLNELSSVFMDAGSWNVEMGYRAVGDHDQNVASDLFAICEENGLYKEYRE